MFKNLWKAAEAVLKEHVAHPNSMSRGMFAALTRMGAALGEFDRMDEDVSWRERHLFENYTADELGHALALRLRADAEKGS